VIWRAGRAVWDGLAAAVAAGGGGWGKERVSRREKKKKKWNDNAGGEKLFPHYVGKVDFLGHFAGVCPSPAALEMPSPVVLVAHVLLGGGGSGCHIRLGAVVPNLCEPVAISSICCSLMVLRPSASDSASEGRGECSGSVPGRQGHFIAQGSQVV